MLHVFATAPDRHDKIVLAVDATTHLGLDAVPVEELTRIVDMHHV